MSKKRRARDSALEITLELARAEDAGDPFAFRFAEQTYLLRQEGGTVESAAFPWDAAVLEDLAGLSRPRPDRAAAQRLGDTIRGFLEQAGWGSHEDDIAEALEDERAIHMTIRSAAAELYSLPFELITIAATGQHLGELPGCLIRYEWPNTRTAARRPDPPPEGGRVLFAWSAAGGAVPADAHLRAIRAATEEGNHPFDPERDVLPHVSLDALQEALSDPEDPVAVLHVLCHGGSAGGSTGAQGLVWNAREGDGPEVIDAGALRQALAKHAGTLRLVVLAACRGGDTGEIGNHLGSVAQALHRVGIPAVIASRYPLSTEGSTLLTEVLYRRLLVDLAPLEGAILAARERLARRAGSLDWASLQLYARAPDGMDHRPFVLRPYRGLIAFQPECRRFYFGREEDIARIIGVLRDGRRLVTLVGASGSGKSSLAMAGIVPAVQGGALGERPFRTAILRPGPAPCQSLWAALASIGEPKKDGDALREAMEKSPEALSRTADDLLGKQPGNPLLLLVIDQFEELFVAAEGGAEGGRYGDDPDATAFIDNVLHATSSPRGRVHAVLTLRADFLGQCLDHLELAERIRASVDIALPMSEEKLREIILRPAELAGITVENGIVDALLDGLRDGAVTESRRLGYSYTGTSHGGSYAAGKLPLLEFALEELWEHREGARLTWQSWRASGGVRGAVAKRADEVLEASSDEERALVRQVFGRLVQVGKGTADTRRRALRSDLEGLAPGLVGPLLDRWIRARLLTANKREVGVAHEALIREWATLRGWIAEDREALHLRQELDNDASRWAAAGRGDDYLWRGGRLERFIELRGTGRLALTELEASFLDASAARERLEQARTEAHDRHQYELHLGVGSRARAALAVLFGVVSTSFAAAWPRLVRPTHAAVIGALAGSATLVFGLVILGRRKLLATRANRQIWAASAGALLAAMADHAIAQAMGAPVEVTVALNLMMGVLFFAILAIVLDRKLAAAAAVLAAASLGAALSPTHVFDVVAVALLLSNVALAIAWRSMVAPPPPSRR